MARSNYMTTIAIDTNNSAFRFYSMVGNDKKTIALKTKSYTAQKLDDDFFEKFKEAVRDFATTTPSESVRKVTIILPDSAVLTDTVKIPTIKGSGQTQKMLDVTLRGLYSNYSDLQILAHMASQNKQYSTIAVTAVQKYIISSIYAACSENKFLVDTLTFASASAVGGAVSVNPKLRNATYLFLDVKDIYSRFAFVVDGKVMGHYTLPFGLEFLTKPKMIQEDMLFDHSYAELTVLNAREKAKSKKLTVIANDTEESDVEEVVQGEEADGTSEVIRSSIAKGIFKKTPRHLPKFMLRERPETEDGIIYENFRIFVKWALTLIQGNEKITTIGKPEFVCVNLPSDLEYVIEMVNEEAAENGIVFTRLPCYDDESGFSSNLELYGGLFPNQINATNKF